VDLPGGVKHSHLLFTPDGARLLAACGSRVHVLSWPGLALQSTLQLPAPARQPGETDCQSVTVSSDSRWLVTVAYRSWFRMERGFKFENADDGVVDLWDLQTGKRVRTVARGQGIVQSAHFTFDNRLLLAEAYELSIPGGAGRPGQGTFALVDLFPPRWLRSFQPAAHQNETILRNSGAARLSPDGRMLYVGYNTGEICAYEVATGQIRRRLHGHRGHVYTLAFTPDGTKLVSGGRDGNALVWDPGLASLAESLKQKPDRALAERLWSQAAVEDAPTAYQALANLTAMPDQAVDLLLSQIEALREPIAPEEKPGARLRQIRALELLEALGTPRAKAILADLAKGDPTAPVTLEAKSALARLRP
jgi:hypothetical protein